MCFLFKYLTASITPSHRILAIAEKKESLEIS